MILLANSYGAFGKHKTCSKHSTFYGSHHSQDFSFYNTFKSNKN